MLLCTGGEAAEDGASPNMSWPNNSVSYKKSRLSKLMSFGISTLFKSPSSLKDIGDGCVVVGDTPKEGVGRLIDEARYP